MAISSSVMEAMFAAGATPAMVIAAVKASEFEMLERKQATREKNAERQRRWRASHNVTPVTRDNRNERDTASKKERSPTPPKEKTTFSEPEEGSSKAADAALGSPIYLDAKHELWGESLPILEDLGIPLRRARPLVGRWMRDIRDDAAGLLEILRRARAEKPQEPISWIARAIPAQARARASPTGRGGGFVAALIERHEENQHDDGDFYSAQAPSSATG